MSERCPELPPMDANLRQTIGAQYHRCRLTAEHEPPCVNAEGVTWGRPLTQGSSDE